MNIGKTESFRDLAVWKKSHELTVALYVAKPTKKIYLNLMMKIRDLAASVSANIAVGYKKRNRNAILHFYRSAQAAAEELAYLLLLAADLRALKNAQTFQKSLEEVEIMLLRLIRSNTQTQ